MRAAGGGQRDQVATVIVQYRQRTHRLRPSFRPLKIHLPQFVRALTRTAALLPRLAVVSRSNHGDAECDEWCCAAVAPLLAPAALAACVHPSRDSAFATRSPAALARGRCGADYGEAYGCALRSRPLPALGSVAATDSRYGARSH